MNGIWTGQFNKGGHKKADHIPLLQLWVEQFFTRRPTTNHHIILARSKSTPRTLSIVAPMVLDQRANPVLLIKYFNDYWVLKEMSWASNLHKHPGKYLHWHDHAMLLDVDTTGTNQRLNLGRDNICSCTSRSATHGGEG